MHRKSRGEAEKYRGRDPVSTTRKSPNPKRGDMKKPASIAGGLLKPG
jgi:hypothetical protein